VIDKSNKLTDAHRVLIKQSINEKYEDLIGFLIESLKL
jgi:hypothetical protein